MANNTSSHFISYRKDEDEEKILREEFVRHDRETKKSKTVISKYTYKLGEEIANEVRYWGQEKLDKQSHNITAMCICPICGEAWRVQLAVVRAGKSKRCCRGKEDGTNSNKPKK